MNKKILILVAILLIGGGSFFAGMQYQKSKRPQLRVGNHYQGMRERFQGQGRPVNGEIIDRDETSITVKLPDGSSRIIFVGDSVQINKSAPGTKDDLAPGTQVFVIGSENPDGSLTATSIQIGRITPQ